ncbi:MAG: alpha-1,2-fucosyltransferase [Akkermansia sp.]|nr:alpha-1,2-fucosyltransferase [Akkermansia sp.]
MILVHTSGGRTGNQVLFLSNLIASALEYGFPFINVCFKSSEYFEHVNSGSMRNLYSSKCVWILWRFFFLKKLHPLLRLLGIRFLNDTHCHPDKGLNQILDSQQNGWLTVMHVWPYADYASLYKHQDTVRQLLHPKTLYIENARRILSRLRTNDCIIIGVHVRRTDYKEWNNGKYFYSIEKYAALMRQLSRIDNRRMVFVVCSDEDLSESSFESSEATIYISKNDYMTDLSLLAQCDYIIGPPSTFASYASFYGNTPRFTIYPDTTGIESFSQFGVSLIDYDDTFETYQGEQIISRMHIMLKNGDITEIYHKA